MISIMAIIYKETIQIPFEKTNVVLIDNGIGAIMITSTLNA